MFATCEVSVVRLVPDGVDDFGAPVYERRSEAVAGCLLEPVSTADETEARRAGDSATAHLHLPKTYEAPVAGCDVVTPDGRTWHVVGDPQPYMAANTPGPWNRLVDLADTRAGER